MTEKNNIELRSDEVQEIIGEIPPWIQRCGITIIALVVFVVFIGACLFSYPETLSGIVVIKSQSQGGHDYIGYATLPPAGFGKVKIRQNAKISTDIYPDYEFGNVMGKVAAISTEPDRNGNYHVKIVFPKGLITNYGRMLPHIRTLNGTVKIVVEEKRLVELFFPAISHILNSN